MLMSAEDYRESLRSYSPNVYINGRKVESVADDPDLKPGIDALGLTYDYARKSEFRPLTIARQHTSGAEVNRLTHIDTSSSDLLAKLELVRLLCQETGCAQRYLTHDAFNALYQSTRRIDEDRGGEYHPRFVEYMHRVQEQDLTTGIAMTDGKGDRSLRPHQQKQRKSYVHIRERRRDGIVIAGTKAIVTGAPYMHDLLVLPGRSMTAEDADFAVACAVPLDAEGITIVARPAGRPGEAAAKFSGKYGQSLGAVIFDDVFVPWDRVFLCGEWEHAGFLTRTYATHHRHSCIGARAGFGDLLIGAASLMTEANGLDLDTVPHLRDRMVELIKIVEGFFACGVASSVYGLADPSGNMQPDPVFANIGKLLLGTHIYDMHRIAHELSGGLIVALPGPEEDHNPATAGDLAETLAGRADIPYARRAEVARLIEDLTASQTAGWYSTISLHGGGSPEAMKMEIYRSYPRHDRVALVERLLDRGVLAGEDGAEASTAQPGRCCPTGCEVPEISATRGRNGGAAQDPDEPDETDSKET